jgi:endonuclease YncB( thermonuclease family)
MKKMFFVLALIVSSILLSACEDPEGYVRLPNLVGLTESAAILDLEELGLVVNVVTTEGIEANDGTFAGYEQRMTGDLVPEGAVVTILIYDYDSVPVHFDGLLISKVLEGSGKNRAVELYNATEAILDLSEFGLGIYNDGSPGITRTVELEGILAPAGTWTIAHPESDPDISGLADLTSEDLVFDGNDAIGLFDMNGVLSDLFGTIGFAFHSTDDRTMVRKETVTFSSPDYDSSDWDVYAKDVSTMFGVHPVPFPETFSYNPDHLAIPFEEPYGMVSVSFDYNYDGDTAKFYPGFNGSDSVRFVGIDTNEIGDVWSYEARDYLNILLSVASTIHLQHDPSAGLTETYGRYLALVWADGVLTNVEMVRMGYSQANYHDDLERLVFEGVTLNRWFELAEAEAKDHGRGIWG